MSNTATPKAPPSGNLSILQHLVSCYKLWFEIHVHIPNSVKYTLGQKTDTFFLETIELVFMAQYLKKEQKLPALQKANTKFDTLKFFLQLLWETKCISTKQYGLLSEKLAEIGKMLGGWLKQSIKQNSPAQ